MMLPSCQPDVACAKHNVIATEQFYAQIFIFLNKLVINKTGFQSDKAILESQILSWRENQFCLFNISAYQNWFKSRHLLTTWMFLCLQSHFLLFILLASIKSKVELINSLVFFFQFWLKVKLILERKKAHAWIFTSKLCYLRKGSKNVWPLVNKTITFAMLSTWERHPWWYRSYAVTWIFLLIPCLLSLEQY